MRNESTVRFAIPTASGVRQNLTGSSEPRILMLLCAVESVGGGGRISSESDSWVGSRIDLHVPAKGSLRCTVSCATLTRDVMPTDELPVPNGATVPSTANCSIVTRMIGVALLLVSPVVGMARVKLLRPTRREIDGGGAPCDDFFLMGVALTTRLALGALDGGGRSDLKCVTSRKMVLTS